MRAASAAVDEPEVEVDVDDGNDVGPAAAKRARNGDDVAVILATPGEQYGDDYHLFKPMHFKATYKDSATKTQHVVIVIVAPSGVCSQDLSKCHLSVDEAGKALILESQWPSLSMNMDKLHQKLVAKLHNEAQLKHACAEDAEAEIRDIWKRSEALSDTLAVMRASEQEVLTSRCRIPLPIQVSRKIDKIDLLGSHDGTSIIYVDLKAEESTYRAMETPKMQYVD